MEYSELEALLTSAQREAVYFTATGEETLSDIALLGQITVDLLRARNPDFETAQDTYRPEVGTSLLISRPIPYLQVQKAFLYSEVVPIEHGTEEVINDSLPLGRRTVQTKGTDGEQRLYYDYVYIDGELVQTVPREDLTEVITPAVTEVVEVGTGAAISGGGGYSGNYAWPLPDWTGMSRGFLGAAHRGLDLNAPYGTPVYASNGGVVIVAGWHWSYGNYVEIEHPDGLVTLYAHNSALYVTQGQSVGQMDPIAAIGSTGVSTGNHCHFEVQVNGVPVDPLGFVSMPG
jgi:murein DD-endopeptidase MepM/ murein hydrolase activator NlpD